MYSLCPVLCFLWWLFNRDMMYDKSCVLTMFASFIPYEPLNNLIEKKCPNHPTHHSPKFWSFIYRVKEASVVATLRNADGLLTSHQKPNILNEQSKVFPTETRVQVPYWQRTALSSTHIYRECINYCLQPRNTTVMGLLAAFVGLRTSWPPRSDVVEYKVKPFADTCLIYRSTIQSNSSRT